MLNKKLMIKKTHSHKGLERAIKESIPKCFPKPAQIRNIPKHHVRYNSKWSWK